MPTERTGIWSATLNGKIYVLGGRGWADDPLPTVEEYDPATNTWVSKADMPTGRFLLSVAAVAGRIYAIGGATMDYKSLPAIEAFRP